MCGARDGCMHACKAEMDADSEPLLWSDGDVWIRADATLAGSEGGPPLLGKSHIHRGFWLNSKPLTEILGPGSS